MNTLLLALLIFTQYFGQNKIQYKDYNFKILATEHFDIYFYQGGDDLAVFAEDVLEDGYKKLSQDLGIEIEFRIPVIIYNSPNDFSQTNVTLELIEESVGGFTEILKNRMVIPFNGDYEELHHVLVHELTHVFQFVIFFPSKLEALLTGDIFYSIPLWVMEGSAEFESSEWDLAADIFMRDLIMNNKVIPLSALGNYGGYVIYKEGQAFYHYLAEKYGRNKVGEFIHLLKIKKNLETTFVSLFGLSVDDLNERWISYYQNRYWPKIGLKENFDTFARVVYDHKKTNSIYNTSSAISPEGDKIAFISDRQGTAEIIIISSIDGRILKRLVRAEYSSGYEGLHLYQGGLSWSDDGKYLSFAAKSKGADVLYILNVKNNRVYKKFKFDLNGIYSPQFSPDGKKILFSGLKDGYLDIYRLNINSGKIEKITDDIYADKYPNFSPAGSIVFVSDRPDSNEEYHYGSYGVFFYKEGNITRLSPRSGYIASPFFNPDSGIFFIADYDSAYNLYFYSEKEKKITSRTDILTGVYYPSISKDGNKIAFVYYNNYGYDVGVVKEPLTRMVDCASIEETVSELTLEETTLDTKRVKKYYPKFTFDYLVASAAYYYPLGPSGMAEIGLSDILGNHQLLFSSNFYGSFTTSDIFISYWYLKKRTDFGAALFQYLNYFASGNDLIIWRYLGAGAMAQYPLDRFLRVELGAYVYNVYETRWLDFFPLYEAYSYQEAVYNFFYPDLAFIFDNAKWGETGPIDGCRVRLEGYTTLFSDYEIKSSILDYRKYFRLSPRASFATRLVLAGSFGKDPEQWSIGGPTTLRGYDYYHFTGTRLGFLNLEYRFPFIDRFKIAFPLPIEIRDIRGALFTDLGGVYTDSFKIYSTEQGFHLKDLNLGIGAGLRFNFLFAVLKLDFARAYNLQEFTGIWRFYFTIGPEW